MTTVREVIDGTVPFFREKPRDVALAEGKKKSHSDITCKNVIINELMCKNENTNQRTSMSVIFKVKIT